MISDEVPSDKEDVRTPISVTVSSHRLIRTIFFYLLGFEFLLVFLDATVNYGEWTSIGAIRRLFNVTREDSLQNWFSSAQTLFVGLVLWLVFLRVKRDDLWKGRGWALLAVFFTYLATDDGAQIHERVGTAVKVSGLAQSFPSYTWHLVFDPFFGAMGLFILTFVWRELKDHTLRSLLMLGLGCYVIKVGLDFVEGLDNGYESLAEALALSPEPVRHFGMVLEEFLKMLGSTLFLVCFLKHFVRISPFFSIRFK